jgi:hypothetical protein
MIGLIVDGEGDYAAFRARYGARVKVLKTGGPRGHEVKEQDIVQGARKQVEILKMFGCSLIAIVTDFEGRSGSSELFCRNLAECLSGCGLGEVKVFAPDRMIENWFLADIKFLASKKKYLVKVKTQKNFESTHGKSELKKFFHNGFDYNEVRHSAELFPLVRGGESSLLSPSFHNFRQGTGLD